jgi:uncharacterized RmlC-like cupin family protein
MTGRQSIESATAITTKTTTATSKICLHLFKKFKNTSNANSEAKSNTNSVFANLMAIFENILPCTS